MEHEPGKRLPEKLGNGNILMSGTGRGTSCLLHDSVFCVSWGLSSDLDEET